MIDELFVDTVVICHHEKLFTWHFAGLSLPGTTPSIDIVESHGDSGISPLCAGKGCG